MPYLRTWKFLRPLRIPVVKPEGVITESLELVCWAVAQITPNCGEEGGGLDPHTAHLSIGLREILAWKLELASCLWFPWIHHSPNSPFRFLIYTLWHLTFTDGSLPAFSGILPHLQFRPWNGHRDTHVLTAQTSRRCGVRPAGEVLLHPQPTWHLRKDYWSEKQHISFWLVVFLLVFWENLMLIMWVLWISKVFKKGSHSLRGFP